MGAKGSFQGILQNLMAWQILLTRQLCDMSCRPGSETENCDLWGDGRR